MKIKNVVIAGLLSAGAVVGGVAVDTAAAPVASVADAHPGHGTAKNSDNAEWYRVSGSAGTKWLGPGQVYDVTHGADANSIIVTQGWRYRIQWYNNGAYSHTTTAGSNSSQVTVGIGNTQFANVIDIWRG